MTPEMLFDGLVQTPEPMLAQDDIGEEEVIRIDKANWEEMINEDDDDEEDHIEETEEQEEAHYQAIVQKVGTFGSADLGELSDRWTNGPPKLNTQDQKHLCRKLAARSIQMWPTKDVELPYADPPVQETESEMDRVLLGFTRQAETEQALTAQDRPEEEKKRCVAKERNTALDIHGEAVKKDQQRVARFWELQRTLNLTNSACASYKDACDRLSLDPDNPVLVIPRISDSPLVPWKDDDEPKIVNLFFWQPLGIEWLIRMEASPLRASILGFDMGLGKTVVAIALVLMAPTSLTMSSRIDIVPNPSDGINTSSERYLINLLARRAHKPTLILCPSSAITVWQDELLLRFSTIRAFFWYGRPSSARASLRGYTIPETLRGLLENMLSFPDEPETERTIYLSSYATFRSRATLDVRTSGAAQGKSKSQAKSPEVHEAAFDESAISSRFLLENGDLDVGAIEDEGMKKQDATKIRVSCRIPEVFKRAICDEAHLLKSPESIMHRAVKGLKAEYMLFMTGTPMINRSNDLLGFVELMWRPEFAVAGKEDIGFEDFEEAKDTLADQNQMLNPDNISSFLHLLNPAFFADVAKGSNGNQLDPAVAQKFIPTILQIIQLRKTFADEVVMHDGQRRRIGQSIPPYRITTVELHMNAHQEAEYYPIHSRLAGMLGNRVDKETNSERNRMDYHRRLVHATMNPILDVVAERCKAKGLKLWYEKEYDNGLWRFIYRTKPKKWLPQWKTREEIAEYLSSCSPKLQWAGGYATKIVHSCRRKLLIFTAWPLTLYLAELYFSIIGFYVLTVRSGHSPMERRAAQAKFNDPSHPSEIMVTSINVSSASINLQQGCSDVLFLDVPGSHSTLLQAICRVFRIGQKRQVQAVVLSLDGTYDQVMQARAAGKYISQIAATAGDQGITVSEDEIDQWMTDQPTTEQCTPEEMRSMAKDIIIFQKCADLYTRSAGQRSERHTWIDALDICIKNQLPVESAFRNSLRDPRVTEVPRFFRRPAGLSLLGTSLPMSNRVDISNPPPSFCFPHSLGYVESA